jgi:5,10-methenyltetrahydrofolate synthetase
LTSPQHFDDHIRMNTENLANIDPGNSEDNAVALRARLRRTRAAISDDARRRGALLMRGRLFTWLALAREAAAKAKRPAPQTVAAFWPMADEPDLRPLLQQWAEAGIAVALPAVREPGAALAFLRWSPETPMQPGAYGILEPQGGEIVVPDVVLTPTLGFTPQSDRLGYGGGYYDRTFAAMKAAGQLPIAIGVAWSEGRLPQGYTAAAHDHRLNAVLTPDGWVPAAPTV